MEGSGNEKKMNEFHVNDQVFRTIDYRYCPHLVVVMLKIKKRFKRRIKVMLISIIISSFLIVLRLVVSHVLQKDVHSLTVACRVVYVPTRSAYNVVQMFCIYTEFLMLDLQKLRKM